MNRSGRILVVLAIVAAMIPAMGCNKLMARDKLNKGVQAYKAQAYEAAINNFKRALELDPSLMNARLYLATAYATQVIPGSTDAENARNADQAIKTFQEILNLNPTPEQRIHCLKGIASLYFNLKKMDQALEYYSQVAQLDPNDPEIYYSIAVIDWTQSYTPRMEARAKLGLKPDAPLTDKKVCADIKAKNQQKVEDGIARLKKAIELRSDYDDAMAYLNLLYRERADYECDDPAARNADIDEANRWVDRTIAVKRQKAEKAGQQTGIVLDEKGQSTQ